MTKHFIPILVVCVVFANMQMGCSEEKKPGIRASSLYEYQVASNEDDVALLLGLRAVTVDWTRATTVTDVQEIDGWRQFTTKHHAIIVPVVNPPSQVEISLVLPFNFDGGSIVNMEIRLAELDYECVSPENCSPSGPVYIYGTANNLLATIDTSELTDFMSSAGRRNKDLSDPCVAQWAGAGFCGGFLVAMESTWSLWGSNVYSALIVGGTGLLTCGWMVQSYLECDRQTGGSW